MSHNLATCRPCRKIYKQALQNKVCRKTVGCSWSKLPGARAIPRRWGRGWSWTRWALGHFEKPKFWFLVLHSVFPIIWSIWSPSVAFLAESIKYVDLPHPALKFSCVNIDEDGGTVHWDGPVCAFFLKTRFLTPYLMHFVMLFTMRLKFTFSQKGYGHRARICGQITTWEAKNK